ncbi:glutamate ligase domain-containing protein, partial [Bradyrhizobium sp. SRS-191]|uniref:glutamate ligase domain-containing protein n=1 Tax=Bradyrhizobium sp. SRS-191 TaxID=2962606 RepID=UPI0027B9963B
AGSPADFVLRSYNENGDGVHLVIEHEQRCEEATLALSGGYQRHNALCAVAVAVTTGVPFQQAVFGLTGVSQIKGRMECVGKTSRGGVVYVDYAHTDDALASALSAAGRAHPGRTISVVFGCGGERDPGKRSKMGAVAKRLADRIYVTDDNPRNDDAGAIRRQILEGCIGEVSNAVVIEEPSRKDAIWAAISDLTGPGVLVIAGKGHEDYQEVQGRKWAFSDQNVAREALERAVQIEDTELAS